MSDRFSDTSDDDLSDTDDEQIIRLRDKKRSSLAKNRLKNSKKQTIRTNSLPKTEAIQQNLLQASALLNHSDYSVTLEALKVISEIAKNSPAVLRDFAERNNEIIRFSSMFIEEENEAMLELLLSIVLTMTAGNATVVAPLVYSGIVPKLIAIYSSQNIPFAKAAIECLNNICLENAELCLFLCKHNFIEAIFKVMASISANRDFYVHPNYNRTIFRLPDDLESITSFSLACFESPSLIAFMGNSKTDIIDLCLNFLLTDSLPLLNVCYLTLYVNIHRDNPSSAYLIRTTLQPGFDNEQTPTSFPNYINRIFQELGHLLDIYRTQYALSGTVRKWRQLSEPEPGSFYLTSEYEWDTIHTIFTKIKLVCEILTRLSSICGVLIEIGEAETDILLSSGIHQQISSVLFICSDLINPNLLYRNTIASDDLLSSFLTQFLESPNIEFSELNTHLSNTSLPPCPEANASSYFDSLSRTKSPIVGQLYAAFIYPAIEPLLRELLFAMSNFSAGTPAQTEIMVSTAIPDQDSPDLLFERLASLFSFAPSCKSDLLYVFHGCCCSPSPAVVDAILRHHIIPVLINPTDAQNPKKAITIMEILINLLRIEDPSVNEQVSRHILESRCSEFLQSIRGKKDSLEMARKAMFTGLLKSSLGMDQDT
ncbi:hypothetical protein BLNAU_4454 [Blattamonas nauphoetae]|uniref:Uncharacterized protein n=1 Tax=Blattamonas nauphoetae TaxID=2049346 RepID=A0ABQ9Y9Y8_9EUKA|nr:hypothetical protein BLNAU_4454 [Blattamonas nauphoetae]